MNFAAKIVKAERSGKCKTQFCDLTIPRRLLSSPEIVKAERSDKFGASRIKHQACLKFGEAQPKFNFKCKTHISC